MLQSEKTPKCEKDKQNRLSLVRTLGIATNLHTYKMVLTKDLFVRDMHENLSFFPIV
jgi:hypothetical protein